MSSDLPCGVTQSMCDNSGGMAIDEDTLCGCGHALIDHEDQNNDEHCMVEDCECKQFTDDYEPDCDDYDTWRDMQLE